MDFKDNFSKQSKAYQRYRPSYPEELFAFLSSLTKTHDLAWDCATGNGQAALGLADFYKKIYATDPSENQLANAIRDTRIIYKNEKAERSSLQDTSVDLITVAQAMHWFDFDLFFSEVKRVLKPKGILAAWTYGPPDISAQINELILHYRDSVVGEYWQRENQYVTDRYSTIPFPFKEIDTPSFTFEKRIDRNDLIGLLESWSATQKFKNETGKDPIDEIMPQLEKYWDNSHQNKSATWNIYMKVGIK